MVRAAVLKLGRGQVQQAVVYDPTRNDLFAASRGRGAFLNDRRIRVGRRTQLQQCLIATGFPFRTGDDFDRYLRMMGEVMRLTAGLRRPGAAALDLAYVAAGRTDGFFETGLSPWDVAAGSLLVQEAGGLIGNFSGEADFLEQRECLAGNPRIYGQLVTLLGKYSRFAPAADKLALAASIRTDASETEARTRTAAMATPTPAPADAAAAGPRRRTVHLASPPSNRQRARRNEG